MDFATVGSLLSISVALLALVFSVITYFRTEREKKRGDLRQFLEDSAYSTDWLRVGLKSFVRKPEPETLDDSVMPSVHDLAKLRQLSLRWQREEFVSEFNALLAAVASPGSAIDESGRKEAQADEVVGATQQALRAADSYATKARDMLLKL